MPLARVIVDDAQTRVPPLGVVQTDMVDCRPPDFVHLGLHVLKGRTYCLGCSGIRYPSNYIMRDIISKPSVEVSHLLRVFPLSYLQHAFLHLFGAGLDIHP